MHPRAKKKEINTSRETGGKWETEIHEAREPANVFANCSNFLGNFESAVHGAVRILASPKYSLKRDRDRRGVKYESLVNVEAARRDARRTAGEERRFLTGISNDLTETRNSSGNSKNREFHCYRMIAHWEVGETDNFADVK